MQAQRRVWIFALLAMVWGQVQAQTGESFIVGNKYRNPEAYIHQNPVQSIGAYGEVDPGDIADRIAQIEKMFPEIYSRFFTAQGQLKAGYQWIDYQRAIQAHYEQLKDDARKLYGEGSSDYRQVLKEIGEEEFNLSVARYFDNKFGNFTSSRSNFRLNVIPVNMLAELNAAGIRTASQLKLYAPDIYRQYIAAKGLQADFYLGPVYASAQPQQGCQPIAVDNPLCTVSAASSAKAAAKAAAACAQNAGPRAAAKIAAQTALQTGAGKKDAAKILSAVGDGLHLNAAERQSLADDFSKMTCTATCNGGGAMSPTPVCVVAPGTNAFDAARLAAQCAAGDPGNAAQIVAATSASVAASKEDSALIMASVMRALNLSPVQQAQFADSVADLNCTDIPPSMLSQSSQAIYPPNPTSPGNDSRNPGNPTGPGDSDDPGTTDPGIVVSPN